MDALGSRIIKLIVCVAAVEPLCHASVASIRKTTVVSSGPSGWEQPQRPALKGVVPPFSGPTLPDTHGRVEHIGKETGLSLRVENGRSVLVLIADSRGKATSLPENPRVPVVKVCISRPR